MANLASLVPQSVSIPRPDNSWLDGIADSLGGLATELGARKSFGALADRIGGGSPAAAPQGGFLSRLTGGAQTQPRASGGRSMAISDVNPSIRDGIIKTASSLGVDPVDLATAISYETGGTFDPTKGGPTTQWGQHRGLIQFGEPQAQKYGVNWDDPIGSQLGENGAVAAYLRDTGVKPGANLLDIYSAINAGGVGRYNASDANNGGAPGTVRDKVEQQMGGHRQRALALLGSDYASSSPSTAAEAIEAISPQAQQQVADTVRFGGNPIDMPYRGPGSETSGNGVVPPTPAQTGQLVTALQSPTSAPSPAQAAVSQMAPRQVADAGNGIIAQGITPIQRGGVDTDTIKFMLRDPNLREAGLKLWAANVQGQNPGEPWQFVNLPDGTLARANQQTGQVERLGNFAKAPEEKSLINLGDGRLFDPNNREVIDAGGNRKKAPNIVELFDEQTGQPYKAQWNEETGQFDRVGGVKARSGMSLTTNPDGTVTLTEGTVGNMPKLTEAEGRSTGFYGRSIESQNILNDLESQGTSLWNSTAGQIPKVGNFLRSEDAQKYDQAKRDFINAVLRRESGAVISPEEFANAEQQYFPQPGDGDEVIKQKRRNRETTIQGLKVSSGQGANFALPSDRQPAKQPQNGQRKTSTGVQWSIEE